MEGGWDGRRRREDTCGCSPDTAPYLCARSHPSNHQKTCHFCCLVLEMAKAMGYAVPGCLESCSRRCPHVCPRHLFVNGLL